MFLDVYLEDVDLGYTYRWWKGMGDLIVTFWTLENGLIME